MDRDNTIARLENIAKHAVHTAGEDIFILNLDDGIAIHEAIEALKAQLSHESTTSDLISRQAAIDAIEKMNIPEDMCVFEILSHIEVEIATLPTIQPVATGTNVGDTISKFIDGLEEIFADLRERHVDDSVCGLCEYDGAYMGQSGDWCNECPGFEKDDCFKLSDKTRKKWTDEIIKALPTVQPERTEERTETHAVRLDAISRQAAIDALDCINGTEEVLRSLPPAQPEPQWIPIERELPRDGSWNIFTDGKNISVERYKADAIDHFFPNGRWFDLDDAVAWMPLPEPYKPNNE